MRYLISTLLILLIIVNYVNIAEATRDDNELLVIVTFNYIKPDVERLLCNGRVVGLVPEGVDPHNYQLRISDIELLKSADLIISTGHTSFEINIRNLVESGELNARLIDIVVDIPGLKLLVNPSTGQLNYHMSIADPINYMAFITHLYKVLLEIDPSNRDCYVRRYIDVSTVVFRDILTHRNSVNLYVIVDKPFAQYLSEWIGLRVVWIFKPEEDYQPTPRDIDFVRELISNHRVNALVLTKPGDTPDTRFLREISMDYNLPIIWIENPASSTGIIESLIQLVNSIKQLDLSHSVVEKHEIGQTSISNAILLITAVSMMTLIGFVTGFILSKKRKRCI